MAEKEESAYDNILSYGNLKQFAEYRRVLVGNRGSMGSGKMATSMVLTYSRKRARLDDVTIDNQNSLALFSGEDNDREPTDVNLDVGASRKMPGLIFKKEAYSEILAQVLARQEVRIGSLLDTLYFSKTGDEQKWQDLSAKVKERLVARNLDRLNKETNTNYRIYGERMHYLTVGRVLTRDEHDVTYNYPLLLFSCSKVDEQKLIVNVDTTGFLNFWIDKNILQDYLSKKLHDNFEVPLNPDLASSLNSLSTEINSMNFLNFKEIRVDPTFLAIQIVTGFEAEYVDPAWEKILEGVHND